MTPQLAVHRGTLSLLLGILAYGTRIAMAAPAISPQETANLHAGMGIMVGEVTSSTALVQVRLSASDQLIEGDLPGAEGTVSFTLKPAEGGATTTQIVEATAERDYIARACFVDLKPATSYICRTRLGPNRQNLRSGPQATFKTLAGPEITSQARLVVVTGMNYARFHGDQRIDPGLRIAPANSVAQSKKKLGYPALESIRKLQPDFFVGTGDNVYYDTPKNGRAQTVAEMRRKWHQQFVQPRYRDLFAAVPTYWEIDDHDFRVDDCDLTGDYDPSPQVGRALMLEQLPYAPADQEDPKTYRTHRINRDLQIWLLENRWYRSPNAAPDGPEKTIWGNEQKAWLKRTLQESSATFKLLISPTPMVGPDDLRKKDNHTNIGGFRHEREEFFAWLNNTGIARRHFYVVCGDRHWQYHSIHPAGIEEFSCGALVDGNARLGRKPGDPKSTDPTAQIQQPYYQTPASGGFLEIEVVPAVDDAPATLTFRFRDEEGVLLHQHRKQ